LSANLLLLEQTTDLYALYMQLAAGFWQLATGYWLLVTSGWRLAVLAKIGTVAL